ncbi:phage tail tape measure protein [Xanthobacter sp. TB0136]|uniref:phage tail tape measure protein n=1 Tax=Xanthobacter sp. TB0136 TaxID=3459177 RepID=UPI0040398738
MTETVDIAIAVDTRQAMAALEDMEVSTQGVARAMSSAFTGLVVQGKDFSSVIQQLAGRLSNLALTAALKPLESGLSSLLSGFTGGQAFAHGGVFQNGQVQPFARGGVVAAPTYFPMSGGGASIGLMGEKGAEAIMPLARGSDGNLGVRMAGAGAAQVTVNVSTPDLAAFHRSEAYLSGLVGRAVMRARRSG